MTIESNAFGQATTVRGEGVTDYATGASMMVMHFPDPTGGEIELETRTIGGFLYQRLPEPMRGAVAPGASTPWVKIDLRQRGGSADVTGTGSESALASLRAISNDVETLGDEDVRGVPTTRYRATVDYDKAIEKATGERREEMIEARGRIGSSVMPIDVWIDDDGLLRRTRVDMSAAMEAAQRETGSTAARGSSVFTTEFYDFGVEVDVVAPPDSEVTDITSSIPANRPGGRSEG